MSNAITPDPHPPKRLIVTQGKGTPNEQRIETGVWLYWVESLQRYCSIPERDETDQ